MIAKLTNLLPLERRTRLKQEYLLRLGTLIALSLVVVLVIHGILLAPSYLYLKSQAAVYRDRLAELSLARAASGYADLASRIATLSGNANRLIDLSRVPSGADAIRSILALPRTGISLSSFTFTPGSGDVDGRMTLMGVATTREVLRNFDLSLNGVEFVKATDLPLSAYATERDIPFTIALTLDFTP